MNTRSGSESATTARRRAYRSDLRSRQASETRARIVASAAETFAERGYAGTSLAEIGRRAGVSTESVAATGPKRSLLFAAFETALAGREGSDPVTTRPELQAILALDPGPMLEALATFLVASAARSVDLWRVISEAALSDPEVARHYAGMIEGRRADHRLAVGVLAGRGLLAPGLDLDEVADAVALLGGPEAYELLVRRFGWTENRLRAWWVATAGPMLFGPSFVVPG